MYFIIYEITNIINGKKYRGAHQTSNLNDGYLGSGKIILLAVKKYGKSNFSKQILEQCSSRIEMLQQEKIWVNKEWLDDSNSYNLKLGGYGFQSEDVSGNKNSFFGKHHSKENKDKHSKFMSGLLVGDKNGFYGRMHSEETKEKIVKSCKRNALYGDLNPAKRLDVRIKISKGLSGKSKSDIHRKKLSASKLRTYSLISPEGEVFKLKRAEIKSFCENRKLYWLDFLSHIDKGKITNKIILPGTKRIVLKTNTIGWEIKFDGYH